MMGKYPPGTLIRLETNEIALVWKTNLNNPELPQIRVIFAADGEMVEKPVTEKLEERSGGGVKIVAVINPLTKGIDVGEYFRQP
jgi:hypothetical protein